MQSVPGSQQNALLSEFTQARGFGQHEPLTQTVPAGQQIA
jgi:hypothetical protein